MTGSRNDEGPGAVFQPDTLLPSQFFAALREKGYVEGEKRLLSAVLTDAVEVFMKQSSSADPRSRELFNDAAEWIFGDFPGWFFSFPAICDVLGLNADYVRAGLRHWMEHRRPGFDWSKAVRDRMDERRPPVELAKAVG